FQKAFMSAEIDISPKLEQQIVFEILSGIRLLLADEDRPCSAVNGMLIENYKDVEGETSKIEFKEVVERGKDKIKARFYLKERAGVLFEVDYSDTPRKAVSEGKRLASDEVDVKSAALESFLPLTQLTWGNVFQNKDFIKIRKCATEKKHSVNIFQRNDCNKPMVIGHRATCLNDVEQMIALGAEMIEVDIQMTSDQSGNKPELVAYWGKVQMGTEQKCVYELTFEELFSLEKSQGRELMKIEDLFKKIQGKQKVFLDIKDWSQEVDKGYGDKIVDEIYKLIKKHKMEKQVFGCTFNVEYMQKLKEKDENIVIGITAHKKDNVNTILPQLIARAKAVKASVIVFYAEQLTEEVVDKLHEEGLRVILSGGSEGVPESIYKKLDAVVAEADQMQADYPRLVESFPDIIYLRNLLTSEPFELREEPHRKTRYHLWIHGEKVEDSVITFSEWSDQIHISDIIVNKVKYRHTGQGIGLTILKYLAQYAQAKGKDIKITCTANYALMRLCYTHLSPETKYVYLTGTSEFVERVEKKFYEVNWLKECGPLQICITNPDVWWGKFIVQEGTNILKYVPDSRMASKFNKFAEKIIVINDNGKIKIRWKYFNRIKEKIHFQTYLESIIREIHIPTKDLMLSEGFFAVGNNEKSLVDIKPVDANLRFVPAKNESQQKEKDKMFAENKDEEFLLRRAKRELKMHPVNMYVDLSNIPKEKNQLEQNMDTLALLISWYNKFGLNVRYILENDKDGRALEMLKGRVSEDLVSCVGVPYVVGETIETREGEKIIVEKDEMIDIRLENINSIKKDRKINAREYIVALKDDSLKPEISIPNYTAAGAMGLSLA
ncbi:MAG: glycerophosphodiester phosphodiesterase family protein, partial [Candidatus Omnitrophota bacterium]